MKKLYIFIAVILLGLIGYSGYLIYDSHFKSKPISATIPIVSADKIAEKNITDKLITLPVVEAVVKAVNTVHESAISLQCLPTVVMAKPIQSYQPQNKNPPAVTQKSIRIYPIGKSGIYFLPDDISTKQIINVYLNKINTKYSLTENNCVDVWNSKPDSIVDVLIKS